MNVPLSSGEMPSHYSGETDTDISRENNDSEELTCPSDKQENLSCNNQNHCDTCLKGSKTRDNIHIKNTRILFFSNDSRHHESTDTSSVVPIFNSNEHERTIRPCTPCLPVHGQIREASAHRDSTAMSLTGGIKGVLKSGRNDPQNHMLANRPIKTVTFVESVTVVTVY